MHPTQHSTHLKSPFPRAADQSTFNPTVQQQRISRLLQHSADAALVWFLSLMVIAAGIGAVRHLMEAHAARRRRARLREAAHRGERVFAGRDWTLPRN